MKLLSALPFLERVFTSIYRGLKLIVKHFSYFFVCTQQCHLCCAQPYASVKVIMTADNTAFIGQQNLGMHKGLFFRQLMYKKYFWQRPLVF